MTFWPTHRRRTPYTETGICRLVCVRCGASAVHQWNICAEGNNFRPLCIACDVALNRLVLEWSRHPDAKELGDRYERSQSSGNAG